MMVDGLLLLLLLLLCCGRCSQRCSQYPRADTGQVTRVPRLRLRY